MMEKHPAGSSPATPDESRFPHPEGWPRGAGYAHAVSTEGRLLFIAGQIGWDPVTQTVVTGELVEQTRRALANIKTILAASGAEPAHLVRLTWFITDRDAYLRHRKAMSVIVVAGLLEPGAMVEIEATAVIPHATVTTNSTGASSPNPR